MKKGYTTYKSQKIVYDYIINNYPFRDKCIFMGYNETTPMEIFGLMISDLYEIMRFKYICLHSKTNFLIYKYDIEEDTFDKIQDGFITYEAFENRYIPNWHYDLFIDCNIDNLIGHYINDIYYEKYPNILAYYER